MLAARYLRRVLPSATIRLAGAEPGLYIRVNVKKHVSLWLWGPTRYERQYVRALRSMIRPGDTVYDVGANIGFYTLLFSRWVGSAGQVIAFEPDPDNVNLLETNLAENGCDNVRVFPLALGEQRGMREFSRDLVTGCTGRLGASLTYGEMTLGDRRVHLSRVLVESIDRLVDGGLSKPFLIKLDIEGGEYHALAGARRTIEEYRPVIVSELTDPEQVLTYLRHCGYAIEDLDTGLPVTSARPWMIRAVASGR